MHLSKKTKTILAWTIPSAVLIAGATISVPFVVINENNKYDTLNKAQDFTPLSFNQISSDENLNNSVNPSNYDIKYFVYKICLSNELINNVFSFAKEGLVNIGNGWKDTSNDVVYRIVNVNILENEEGFVVQDNNYVFTLEIKKEYKNSSRTYTKEITIPTSSFASVENSKKNFVTNASKSLNSLLMSQDIKFFVEDAEIQSIDRIDNSNDLNIKTSGSLATSFRKIDANNQVKYLSNNSEFEYLLGDKVSFSTPINENGTKLVINSEDAYKFNSNGEFDTTTQLFTFLKSQQAAGHLTYLPELSKEETRTLSKADQIDKQIQKLIFDPENTTYVVKDGKKIPPANYQAVVTKVELGEDAYTYLVAWSNIFTVSGSIVDNASELELKVNPHPDGTQLTWEELQQPANFSYISTIQKPQNNLIYKIKEVSFNDTYKTNAIVKVEISSEALGPQITKTYETQISTGFKSEAYVSLEKQINQKLSSASDLSPLKPTVTKKDGVTDQDLYNNVYNLKALSENLNIEPPQGLDQALYTITNTRLNDNNQITIWFKISSVNDPERYWTYNSSVAQEIIVVIDLVLDSN